jgi:GxxExxY protein
MEKLLYKDLTYAIRGAMFQVHQQLGPVHKESVYQRALEHEFSNRNIAFESQKRINILYDYIKVGAYVPDFVIENKVILEIKAVPLITKQMEDQIWYYVRASAFKIVLLANFGAKSLDIRRRIYNTTDICENPE